MRALFVLVASVLAGSVLVLSRQSVPPSAGSLVAHRRAEAARLRAHFDSVDLELRQGGSEALSAGQQASRTRLITWLRDYRNGGVFPENDKFPDRAMPFFRDSKGVLCAMAYLVARSGRTDLVDAIARTRNNAFIAELAGDTALSNWLREEGLTAAEAARIQPTYGPPPTVRISTAYALVSAASSGTALTATGFNVISPSVTSGWLGLGAGIVAGFVGAVNLDAEGDSKSLAVANLAVGVTSVVLSIRGFNAVPGEHRRASIREAADQRRFRTALVPFLRPTGAPGIGIVVQARF